MSDGDEHVENIPSCSFEIYRAEGDVLFKHGNYKKALLSYTKVCHYITSVHCMFYRGGD